VVAAMVAAQSKEIPMTKAKAKRKPASRADDSKTRSRNKRKANERTQHRTPQAYDSAASAAPARGAADGTP
jgi:hypothetical protein